MTSFAINDGLPLREEVVDNLILAHRELYEVHVTISGMNVLGPEVPRMRSATRQVVASLLTTATRRASSAGEQRKTLPRTSSG